MPFFGVPIRNGLPIGLGSVAGFGVQQFDPSQLFEGGTVAGAWYDPSDLSTMFTTSAGTTPVAMPGQGAAVPVGAMLDKRASAYSVYFDGSGDFLTLDGSAGFAFGAGDFTVEAWIYRIGAVGFLYDSRPASTNGNYLLVGAGATLDVFVNGATILTAGTIPTNTWTHIAVSRSGSDLRAFVNGSQVGSTITNTTNFINGTSRPVIGANGFNTAVDNVNGYISNVRIVKGTAVYTGNFTPPTAPLSPISGTSLLTCGTTWAGNPAITTVGNTRVDGLNPFTASPVGNHAIAFNNTTARPELRARVNLLVATATLSTQSVTTQATSYTLSFAGTGSITLSGTATGSYSAGTHTITCTAGTLTLTVSGTVTTADLRPANSGALLPAYQAVVDANTYDTNGFPLYLLFDGIDDSMYTPANLNLSGTDKVAVFAGVRKLSSTSTGFVAETSAAAESNNGAFRVGTDSGGIEYFISSRGTTSQQVNVDNAAYTSPVTNVVQSSFDIAAPLVSVRINGTAVGSNSGSQGTGNYGTYPLYIGARNNSAFWLNGHLHSLIIAGSAVSAGNISATEQWVAGRTGISIP